LEKGEEGVALEKDFLSDDGLRERMTKARIEVREVQQRKGMKAGNR